MKNFLGIIYSASQSCVKLTFALNKCVKFSNRCENWANYLGQFGFYGTKDSAKIVKIFYNQTLNIKENRIKIIKFIFIIVLIK